MTTLPRLVLLLSLLSLAGCTPVSAERHQTPAPDAETALAQQAIAAVMAGGQPVTETFVAPDGQWQVEIIRYSCVETGDAVDVEPGSAPQHAYELLRLAAGNAGEWRQVDSQLLNCGGLGAFGLAGLCWSPDSRYFYYTPSREGVPDGAGEWSRPVWQLEAVTGAIEEVDETAAANIRENFANCGALQR